MDVGQLVACLFLVNLILAPVAELGEILDQTQTAIAGWRKVLDVLDIPVDVVEPDPGVEAARLADLVRGGRASGFAYREGGLVLHDVDVTLPAGVDVAVVGETGSGKTTFAKLLCRLADPTGRTNPHRRCRSARRVRRGRGIRRRAHGAPGRLPVRRDRSARTCAWGERTQPTPRSSAAFVRARARLVGRPAARRPRHRGRRAGREPVGRRASAGGSGPRPGRQSGSADPRRGNVVRRSGDRAGAVDRVGRLAAGRTTVSVAHRLSTAEAADLVLVFDRGEIVERGRHDELVAAGGRYAELFESWLGNTRASVTDD